jgi:hypothetical protein
MIVNKTIIIISPDNWNSLPVSKHHYAEELAKLNRVYFVNPLNNDLDKFENNVNIINNYRNIKGLRFFPKMLKIRLMSLEIKSIINKIKEKQVDIVWSFDTSRLYYLELFNAQVNIAHIVDYTEHFFFKELISSANFCFATSDSIIDKIKIINNNVYKINHGYFQSISKNGLEKVDIIKSALYIGNLTIRYLDWKAIYKITNHRKDIVFVFVGTNEGKLEAENALYFEKVNNLENVEFRGKLSPSEVVLEMDKADFCILAYQFDKFPLQLQNPHKIMQYLGSGKPVFASYTHEYKDTDLIFMYNDLETIETSFDAFLKNENNHFSEESRQKRINFALDNTYPKQIERIAQIIQNNK